MKSKAFFDLDDTLYQGFSCFELLREQVKQSLIEEVVLHQALAVLEGYRTGQATYEEGALKLFQLYAIGLKDQSYEAIYQATLAFYRQSPKFYAFVRPLLSMLQTKYDLYLVTSEPQFAAQAVQELFGFTAIRSTEYEVVNGRFTGQVAAYVTNRQEKLAVIQNDLAYTKDTMAFGDSESDLAMLGAVDYPICLNSKSEVQKIAQAQGWTCATPETIVDLVRKIAS